MSLGFSIYNAWRTKRRIQGAVQLQGGLGDNPLARGTGDTGGGLDIGKRGVQTDQQLPGITSLTSTHRVTGTSTTTPHPQRLLQGDTITWRTYASSARNNHFGQKATVGSAVSPARTHHQTTTTAAAALPPGGLEHSAGGAHEQHHNGEVFNHQQQQRGLVGNTGGSQLQSSSSLSSTASSLHAPLSSSTPEAGSSVSSSPVYDLREPVSQAWTQSGYTSHKGGLRLDNPGGTDPPPLLLGEASTSQQKVRQSGFDPVSESSGALRKTGLYQTETKHDLSDVKTEEHVPNTLSLSEEKLKQWTSDSIADHFLGDPKTGDKISVQVDDSITRDPTLSLNVNRTGILDNISDSLSDILANSNSSNDKSFQSFSSEFKTVYDNPATASESSLSENTGWLNSTRTLLISNTTNLTLSTGGGGIGASNNYPGGLHSTRRPNASGITPESPVVGTTPFPGYLSIKDFSWDLSEYPDSLSMFSNLSDCIHWSTNDSYGCYYGGFGNVTNVSLGGTGQTGLGGSGSEGAGEDVYLPTRYWALLLVFFPLLTLIGNVMVVTSVYRERALRTVTNYFIVSLAIADIAVALFVMPLAIYTEVSRSHFLHYLIEVLPKLPTTGNIELSESRFMVPALPTPSV